MKKYLLLLLISLFTLTQNSYANDDSGEKKMLAWKKSRLIQKYTSFRNYVDNLKIQKKNVYRNHDSYGSHRIPKNTTECIEAGNYYNIRITDKLYKELTKNHYNLPKKVDLNECSLKNIK
jgi:hypothetical protein